MKSVEHRKLIYSLVEKLLGRELTKEEHEELKTLLTSMNHDATKDLITSNARMSAKLKPMGKSLWNLLHNKGTLPEELKFLRDALELTDEDLKPKEKKEPAPKS